MPTDEECVYEFQVGVANCRVGRAGYFRQSLRTFAHFTGSHLQILIILLVFSIGTTLALQAMSFRAKSLSLCGRQEVSYETTDCLRWF